MYYISLSFLIRLNIKLGNLFRLLSLKTTTRNYLISLLLGLVVGAVFFIKPLYGTEEKKEDQPFFYDKYELNHRATLQCKQSAYIALVYESNKYSNSTDNDPLIFSPKKGYGESEGYRTLPGGRLDDLEDEGNPFKTASREFLEETGLSLKDQVFKGREVQKYDDKIVRIYGKKRCHMVSIYLFKINFDEYNNLLRLLEVTPRDSEELVIEGENDFVSPSILLKKHYLREKKHEWFRPIANAMIPKSNAVDFDPMKKMYKVKGNKNVKKYGQASKVYPWSNHEEKAQTKSKDQGPAKVTGNKNGRTFKPAPTESPWNIHRKGQNKDQGPTGDKKDRTFKPAPTESPWNIHRK